MGPRFDDLIPFHGGKVLATGPLHEGDDVKEICAWVFQRKPNGSDAAATEMTTSVVGKELFKQDPHTRRWRLLLMQLGEEKDDAGSAPPPPPFEPGRAFAVAVALIATPDGSERVTWWGQPLDLAPNAAAVLDAEDPDTDVAPPLPDPDPPTGT